MNRSLHSSNTDYQQSISGLLSLLRAEFLGVLCIIGGALLIASVFGYDSNSRDAAPLLYVLMGWTAPLFAAMILVLGCVLLLGQRAGYWSAEALVGAELLLLGLQLGAWVAANRVVTWTPRLGMEAGGLIGWALGSLALAGLDRPLAGLLAALLVAAAILMLIRYTPLIFLAAPLRRWLPFSKAPQPQRGFAPTAAPPPVVGGHVVSSPTPDGSVRTAPAAPLLCQCGCGPARTGHPQDAGRLQRARAHHPCGDRPDRDPVWRRAALHRTQRPEAQGALSAASSTWPTTWRWRWPPRRAHRSAGPWPPLRRASRCPTRTSRWSACAASWRVRRCARAACWRWRWGATPPARRW
jgi:hypothetical protein